MSFVPATGFDIFAFHVSDGRKEGNVEIEEYAEIAPQYYDGDMEPLLEKYLAETKWQSLLDCGCGDGGFLFSLYKRGYARDKAIRAVDFSKSRIELVKKIDPSIQAAVDNAEDLATIPDASVDFLVSTQVIEHVDDAKMIATLDRVVKDGATLYLSTVYKKWYGWYFYRNQKKQWALDPTHLREYRCDSELLDKLAKERFTVLENVKKLQYFPVIDFFVKRLGIKNRLLYSNRFVRLVRKIRVPIFGYYNWIIVLKKK